MSGGFSGEFSSEFRKMISGEVYNAEDTLLIEMRNRARRLNRRFNLTTEESPAERYLILKELFGEVGEKIYIEPPFFCDYGVNVHAGSGLYMNFGCVILDCASVHFGENVLCGPTVQIYTVNHPLDATLRSTGAEFTKPIRIGNNVWIGGHSVICPGVSIGDNTTVGAGSVVTKNLPANVLAAGNPCKVIRELA